MPRQKKSATTKPTTPAPTPEVKEETKSAKGEYRVVGTYYGQEIDRVYTDKDKAEGFALKINGKVI